MAILQTVICQHHSTDFTHMFWPI